MGGVAAAAMASRSWIAFKTKRRLKRQAKAPRERGRCLAAAARCVAKRLFLTLASTAFGQRKAGCRAAVRSEPVTWRSWMRPGCHAMQRNHCPPSLTTVVPASIRAHSRLVSVVWNPRTTCRRAHKGRLSAVPWPPLLEGAVCGGCFGVVEEGGVAAPATRGALPGALAADIGVVDLDPRPAGAKLIAAVPLAHRLHQFVLNPPGGIGRDPKAPAQLDVGQPFLALSEQMHGTEPHPHRQLGALQDGAGDQRRLIAALPAL